MSKAKMEAARELIKEKQYDEARAILRTVNHPLAAEWIAKIDAISSPKHSRRSPILALVALGIVLVGVMAVVVYTQRYNIPPLAAMFSTATPTATATSTLTPTTAATPTTDTAPQTATAQQHLAATASAIYATNTAVQGQIDATQTARSASPTPGSTGKWQSDASTSPMDDTKTILLYLDADNKVQGAILTETPSLVVRCRNNKLDLYVVTQMQVDSGLDDIASVRLRFDKTSPASMRMSTSTSGDAIFFPDARTWLYDMARHDQMVFEFTPNVSSPVQAVFDLHGLPTAMAKFEGACDVLPPQ